MAAVPLFRDTNIAAVTSRKNTLYGRILRLFSKVLSSLVVSKATEARQSSKATKLHIWFVLNKAIRYCLLTRRAFGHGSREKS